MYAEAAVGQQNQRFNVLTLQFARCRHLFEFFSHKVP
jgi:hypothetical protein